MTVLIEILLFLALFAALFFGGSALVSQSTELTTNIAKFGLVLKMITGNMKNIAPTFPVYDLAIGFGAVIISEIILIGLRIAKFFIKFKSQK